MQDVDLPNYSNLSMSWNPLQTKCITQLMATQLQRLFICVLMQYEKYTERSKEELTQVERDFIEHIKSTQKKLEKGKG